MMLNEVTTNLKMLCLFMENINESKFLGICIVRGEQSGVGPEIVTPKLWTNHRFLQLRGGELNTRILVVI